MSSGSTGSDPRRVRAGVPGRGVRGGRLRAGAGLRRIEQRPVRPVQGQADRAAAVGGRGDRRRPATARTRTVKVKVAAQVQPVLPAGPAGVPFVPVEFTGLTVHAVRDAGREARLLAQGNRVRAPGRPSGRPGAERAGVGGVSGDGGSFSHMSVHVGADWRVVLPHLRRPRRRSWPWTPGRSSISITTRGRERRRGRGRVRPGAGPRGAGVRRRDRAAARRASGRRGHRNDDSENKAAPDAA